jgi:glycerophosphoryl diester phosphodiesterase
MPPLPRPVRIAHAFGNSRDALKLALEADVDMIEVDVWYRDGKVHIHHARRLSPLPILVDRRMPGHPLPPFAVPLWKGYWAWPHLNPIDLEELLGLVAGRKHLLLDVKGRYKGGRSTDFAAAIARDVRAHSASGWAVVCGQSYPPLNALRRLAPEIEVRYSLEKPYQWESFLRKMHRDERVRQVCIAHGFIDEEKARIMEAHGIDLYVWTVDDPERALHWVNQGADGIISNKLELLAALPREGDRALATPDQVDG